MADEPSLPHQQQSGLSFGDGLGGHHGRAILSLSLSVLLINTAKI